MSRALHKALGSLDAGANFMMTKDDRRIARRLGSAVRLARMDLGLTKQEIAHDSGLSLKQYNRVEQGLSLPSVPTFLRLLGLLGLCIDRALGREPGNPAEVICCQPQAPLHIPPRIQNILPLLVRARPTSLALVTMLLKEIELGKSQNQGKPKQLLVGKPRKEAT